MGLKALARMVLDKNKPLNMTLNSDGNLVQSGGVQIEQTNPQDWQHFYGERAAVLEHDHELPGPEAERRAFEMCVVEYLNRTLTNSAPGRCAWCGEAEDGKAAVLPFGTTKAATWLHGPCWKSWYRQRHQEAVSTLAEMGIGASATSRQDGRNRFR